jgi:hypothetical protein
MVYSVYIVELVIKSPICVVCGQAALLYNEVNSPEAARV